MQFVFCTGNKHICAGRIKNLNNSIKKVYFIQHIKQRIDNQGVLGLY